MYQTSQYNDHKFDDGSLCRIGWMASYDRWLALIAAIIETFLPSLPDTVLESND